MMMAPEKDKNGQNLKFMFDYKKVLEGQDQRGIYDLAAKDSMEQFFNGYNSTIFAYGQSGSGKTYTLLGPEIVRDAFKSESAKVSENVKVQYGIIPRAIVDLFKFVQRTKE